MGDFPVAAGCWTEEMVIREAGDPGLKNGSSVEEEDGQGGLQAGEKEGRVSRAHGVAPTLWGRVEVGRGSQQNEIFRATRQENALLRREAGAAVCRLHANDVAGQGIRRYLQLQPTRVMTMPRRSSFGG
jgi:hypothetical protein